MGFLAGPFFLFLGLGTFLGVVYVTLRYVIPLVLFAGFLVLKALGQVGIGFWGGITGKRLPARAGRSDGN